MIEDDALERLMRGAGVALPPHVAPCHSEERAERLRAGTVEALFAALVEGRAEDAKCLIDAALAADAAARGRA